MTGSGQVRRSIRGMGRWQRRGLLAGLAGVVAGVLAHQTDQTVEAGHNSVAGANPLHLRLNNTNDTNTITTMTAGVANGFAFRVDNNGTNGSAFVGESAGSGIAVRGNSSKIGVLGVSSTNAPPVAAPAELAGVVGIGDVRGVRGQTTLTTGTGVEGVSSTGNGGEGQLTDGFRRVPIDPKFASTVDLSGQYHVVITPLAEAILYVTNRTSESFDVRAIPFKDRDDRQTPSAPIRFTWWVIGRRKDIKGPRFEEVKIPPTPKLT